MTIKIIPKINLHQEISVNEFKKKFELLKSKIMINLIGKIM